MPKMLNGMSEATEGHNWDVMSTLNQPPERQLLGCALYPSLDVNAFHRMSSWLLSVNEGDMYVSQNDCGV